MLRYWTHEEGWPIGIIYYSVTKVKGTTCQTPLSHRSSNSPGLGPDARTRRGHLLIHPINFRKKTLKLWFCSLSALGITHDCQCSSPDGIPCCLADSTFAKHELSGAIVGRYPPRWGEPPPGSYRTSARSDLKIGKREFLCDGGRAPPVPENYLAAGASFLVLGEGEQTLAILPLLLSQSPSEPAQLSLDPTFQCSGLVVRKSNQATFIRTSKRSRMKNLDELLFLSTV